MIVSERPFGNFADDSVVILNSWYLGRFVVDSQKYLALHINHSVCNKYNFNTFV